MPNVCIVFCTLSVSLQSSSRYNYLSMFICHSISLSQALLRCRMFHLPIWFCCQWFCSRNIHTATFVKIIKTFIFNRNSMLNWRCVFDWKLVCRATYALTHKYNATQLTCVQYHKDVPEHLVHFGFFILLPFHTLYKCREQEKLKRKYILSHLIS